MLFLPQHNKYFSPLIRIYIDWKCRTVIYVAIIIIIIIIIIIMLS